MKTDTTVHRYYNNFDHDHVYTTNYHKWGKGGSYRTPDGEHGYTYEVGLCLCLFLCVICVWEGGRGRGREGGRGRGREGEGEGEKYLIIYQSDNSLHSFLSSIL